MQDLIRKELPSRQQCRGPGLTQKEPQGMSTRDGGKRQVAGEDRKEHLDRERQEQKS